MKTRSNVAWGLSMQVGLALLCAAAGCSDSGSESAAPAPRATAAPAAAQPQPAAPNLPATAAAQPAPAVPTAAAPAELDLDLGGGVTMKMVLIRPGKFMMGSPDSEQGRGGNEGPQHEVVISKPFYMGVTEVTQAQYEAVMGTNPSMFKGARNPVNKVSWDDATEFCKKLSEKIHQTVRLPTEAEWEYACRAGTQTKFSFGDDPSALGDYAWQVGNSDLTLHPVGQKKPNPWGLYDMHGSVCEWCADWLGGYPKGPVTDPSGPVTDSGDRVLRGGSWTLVGPADFRCAYRNNVHRDPTARYNLSVGFRCAMTP